MPAARSSPVFFFNDTATTEIYTLSLHDALPIFLRELVPQHRLVDEVAVVAECHRARAAVLHERLCVHGGTRPRSEEHTSELQSRLHLVCRLLLEKKKSDQPVYLSTVSRNSSSQP